MAQSTTLKACLLFSAALALGMPTPAIAQTSADLAERVRQLEASLTALQGELRDLREREAREASPVTLGASTGAAPIAAPAAPSAPRAGGTTFKFSGFVKAEALLSDYSGGDIATGSGRDFYIPSATPVGAPSEDPALDMHAKQTRLAVTVTRDAPGHTLAAYVEADFQSSPGTGTEVVTNAYNFAVRRATITFDNWLFGEDWSTFQNVSVLPETTDFIGPTEGTVFARQALIRYTWPLAKTLTLSVAAENPETTAQSLAAPAIASFDDDAAPDLVARLNWTAGRNQFALAGIGRRLSMEEAGVSREASGWGVSGSGKIALGARDDLRFMITHGEGVGRYVGLGFAADAVMNGADIEPIGVTAGFAAYRHFWSSRLRSSLVYSAISVDNEKALTPAASNDASTSYSANVFYTPVDGFDLGVEYRFAKRELVSGASGEMDRIHLIAKQSF